MKTMIAAEARMSCGFRVGDEVTLFMYGHRGTVLGVSPTRRQVDGSTAAVLVKWAGGGRALVGDCALVPVRRLEVVL